MENWQTTARTAAAAPKRPTPGLTSMMKRIAGPLTAPPAKAPFAAPTGPVAPTPMGGAPQLSAAAPVPPVGAVPPPPPIGGVPPTKGVAVSPIDPKNDLRFTAITPEAGGPDRTALAQGQFRDLMANSADQRAQGVRAIGQGAAKFGRIGAGMTTNELTSFGDLSNRRELEAARGLSSDVAGADIQDRANQRNEYRDERDYQYGAGRDAGDDAFRELMANEDLTNSAFGRDVTRHQLGYQGNPAGVQSATGESYADDASNAFSDSGELMRMLALRKAQAGVKPAVATPPYAAPVAGNTWDY